MDEDQREGRDDARPMEPHGNQVEEPAAEPGAREVDHRPHVSGRPDLPIRVPEPGRTRGQRLIRYDTLW